MMKNKESLIYDLIFSDENDFEIEISEYIEDVYKYDKFVSEMKKILKKAKVMIVKSNLDIQSKRIIWYLKVKK
jgi:hypothetical protein